MTTELSFLIDLLLNQKLTITVKKMICERIKEVEARLGSAPAPRASYIPPGPPQAASTLALMAKHKDILDAPEEPAPVPVENIAQTPAAVQAMMARNEAINAAVSGRNVMKDKGKMERTSPRKW